MRNNRRKKVKIEDLEDESRKKWHYTDIVSY